MRGAGVGCAEACVVRAGATPLSALPTVCIARISFSVTYSGNACTNSSGPCARTIATPYSTPLSVSVPGKNLIEIHKKKNVKNRIKSV